MRLPTEFLRLPLRFDVERLRAEVDAIPVGAWRRHPQGFAGNTAAILVSANGEENDDLAGPMRPTATLLRAPYLMQVLAAFETVVGRSRLMRIEAEGRVPPHADVAYYWSKRVRIHVPIVTDPEVRFVCAGKPVHMAAGEAWIFDNWKQHWVENPADHARIHLVADTVGSEAFWKLSERAYRPFDSERSVDEEPRFVAFDSAVEPRLSTEAEESWSVMPPSEVERVLGLIESEVAASPQIEDVDRRRLAETLTRFRDRWRDMVSNHSREGGELRSVLDELRAATDPLEGRMRFASNGIDPIRVLRAHLLEQAWRPSTSRSSQPESVPSKAATPPPAESADVRPAVTAIGRGALDEADRVLDAILAKSPRQADALHLAGVVALQRRRPAVAVERFRAAIDVVPAQAEYHGNLGVALLSLGQLEEARAAFQRAIELRADYAEAHDNLGLVLGRIGEPAAAIASHARAVELKPSFGTGWLHLARARERVGDEVGAEAAYRQATTLNGSFVPAAEGLATLLQRAGRLDEAIEALRWLVSRTRSASAWNRLGAALGRRGDHDGAREAFEQALAIEPANADALNNLGTSLAREERFEEAGERFEQATRTNPRHEDTWANLARVNERLGDHDGARRAYARLGILRDDDADVLERLAVACERCGEWDEARRSHERALRIDGTLAIGWMGLARVYDHEGRRAEAVAAGRKGIEHAPDLPDARHLLGTLLARDALDRMRPKSVLSLRNLLTEAVEVLERANELEPRAGTFEVLGTLFYRLERFNESTAAFETALELDENLAESLDGLGNAHLDAGRFDEAATCFRAAITKRPTLGRPHFHLLRAERVRDDDVRRERLAQVEELLGRGDELTNNDRVHLHFAAGTLLEGLGEYEPAFEHLSRGNSLKPRPGEGGPPPFAEIVDRTIEVFDDEFFRSFEPRGSESNVPIFVVGMPRSGTTLVEQILSSHPRIAGAGELKDIGVLADSTAELVDPTTPYPQSVPKLDEDRLRTLADRFLDTLEAYRGDAERVTDKMPTNFLHLGLVSLMFPHATVIRCVRDPRDVCVSCFRQNLDWPFCDLTELGRYHHSYERLMAHWQRVLPLTIHEVVYEELVEDVETHGRGLVAACDLEWDDRCARFHENDRAVRTPSKAQVRQPIYSSSVGRWRVYEEWLGPLLDELEYCAGEEA